MAAPAGARRKLTERQTEIVDLLLRGYRGREAAAALGISERAVTAHVSAIKKQLGVRDRSGLIAAVLASRGFRVSGSHPRYAGAPFLVAVTRGPEHRFTDANRMWERVMGLRRRDVVGKAVTEVFPERSRSTYAARQRAYRTGRPATGKAWHYRWRAADGTPREADFRFIYQPLRGARGRIEGLLLIATEVGD